MVGSKATTAGTAGCWVLYLFGGMVFEDILGFSNLFEVSSN